MGIRSDQKEQRRQDILQVSLTLFVRNGFTGTTIRDIAAEAGISPGLLFHYFDNKEEILIELLGKAHAGVQYLTDQLDTAPDPLEGFRDIARAVLFSFSEASTVELFLLVQQAKTFHLVPQIEPGILDTAAMIDQSIGAIQRGQKNGSIKQEDPRALSLAFWASLQGIAEILSWYPSYPIPPYDALIDILRKR